MVLICLHMAIFQKEVSQLTSLKNLAFWLAKIKTQLLLTNRLATIRDHMNPERLEIASNITIYFNHYYDYTSKNITNNASLCSQYR